MMHNRIKNALPAVVFLLALAGYMIVGDHVFERTGPEYVFSYGENQGEDYPTTMGAYRFAQLVEEQTEGRIKILVTADGG